MSRRAPAVEVLLATMDCRDPQRIRQMLGLSITDIELLIVNQVTKGLVTAGMEGKGYRMLSYAERGLSKSRNRALDAAQGDIVLLADDDIRYRRGISALLRAEFDRYPEAAAITFQYVDATSQRPTKRYGNVAHHHSRRTLLGVSSIEIALRPALLKGVRFDERFGLGADLPCGEEALFLSSLLDAGAQVMYCPRVLCEHQGPSSGYRAWSSAQTRAKGAVIRRLFPDTWPAVLGVFALIKCNRYGAQLGAVQFAKDLFAGAVSLESSLGASVL